jgi:pimeloyl-ACP methyl ester carboxylesterase
MADIVVLSHVASRAPWGLPPSIETVAEGVRRERARVVVPRARHVTLRDCGHIPTFDDPEQVARVILESVDGRG